MTINKRSLRYIVYRVKQVENARGIYTQPVLFYVRNQLTSQGYSTMNNVTSGLFFLNFNIHFNTVYNLRCILAQRAPCEFKFSISKINNISLEISEHEGATADTMFAEAIFNGRSIQAKDAIDNLAREIVLLSNKRFADFRQVVKLRMKF